MTKRMLFGTLMMVWLLVALFSCNHSQTKKEYFPNGKVKEITHWIGNTQVGDYEIYHENGVLANKGRLNRKSCCVGTCYSYYDDGSIMSIEKHDRRGKLITFDFWGSDGKQSVFNGTGVATNYYPDGRVQSVMSYKDCHFEGCCEYWHPNGIKGGEFFYKDGKPVGVWHFWNENGELVQSENHDVN